MTALGVGVVGCGGAALDVARAIDTLPEQLRVAAGHDRDPDRARAIVDPRRGTVHSDLEALVSDPEVDLVYVGVPHHLLAPTARRALAAGRHVLVEKPAALTVTDLVELAERAEADSLVVGVVFELRETGPIRAARELLAQGAIGTVRMVRIRTVIDKPATYWRLGPSATVPGGWRGVRAEAGGGVVLMNSIHQLDLVRHLTGLRFTRAAAEVATLAAVVEVEDAAAAVLRLSNGGLASLTASAHSPGAEREERIEIDGEYGRLDLPDPYGPGAARLFLRRPWQQWPAGEWLTLHAEPVDCHAELLRGFARAVRTRSRPPAGVADAAAALATVLGIYESATSGQAVDIAT